MASESSPQMFVATSTSTEITNTPPPKFPAPLLPPPVLTSTPVNTTGATGRCSGVNRRSKDADLLTQCNVCDTPGTSQNLVLLVFIFLLLRSTTFSNIFNCFSLKNAELDLKV